MLEMLDIYDDNLVHLGTKPRPDVHHDGDWHRVFHCWVLAQMKEQAAIIVQKRAADKETFASYLDVSAAGHYAAGETVRDGLRELDEELGLQATFEDLIPLGQRVSAARYQGLIDREVADVFFYRCDQPLSAYRYQKEEIAGLLAVPLAEGLALFSGERDAIAVSAVGLGSAEVSIRVADFIPTPDRYFYKVLILAQRYLQGERHLLI